MLKTNERLSKLAAARVDFAKRGMLDGTCLSDVLERLLANHPDLHDDGEDGMDGMDDGEGGEGGIEQPPRPRDAADEDAEGEEDEAVDGPQIDAFVVLARRPARGYPKRLAELGTFVGRPELPERIGRFLAEQHGIDPDAEAGYDRFIDTNIRVTVFPSAVATFYAPGDPSGTGGMRREWIRATQSWRSGPPRYDCAYVSEDPLKEGFSGLHAVRVRLLFSFVFMNVTYPCALVEWFVHVGEEPDEETGMWVVEPEFGEADERRPCEVIHLDTIVRAAHLAPMYGDQFIPRDLESSESLDAFRAYLVNKFVDYHAHQNLF